MRLRLMFRGRSGEHRARLSMEAAESESAPSKEYGDLSLEISPATWLGQLVPMGRSGAGSNGLALTAMITKDSLSGEEDGLRAVANVKLGVEVA